VKSSALRGFSFTDFAENASRPLLIADAYPQCYSAQFIGQTKSSSIARVVREPFAKPHQKI
jgi:hypothetical protein